ncbi:MAG: hypothetical protein HY676_03365 [Chloroflexi bacterium]|nr:hypothetical protein [Chloroflexota bacterium]
MADATVGAAAVPSGLVAGEIPRPPRTIVSVATLPFVALALIYLLVSVIGGWRWALTFAHVAFGAAWTIIDLFLGLVIGPILGRMPIRARLELITRLMPKMSVIMPTVVVVTLVAGFQLGLQVGVLYSIHPYHAWILASFAVVGVMALIALGINEPANLAVLFELRKPEPNLELVGQLMRRFIYTAGILGIMQLSILIIMARVAS